MPKSSDLYSNVDKLKEKLASSEDPKAVAEEAIALAKTAIDALDKAERDIKILTGF